jgi:predicted PhzF superfamily epimerase YddE/YHI9
MRVGSAEINVPDLVNQIKARKMPKRSRAPNCTHLVMDRVFGRDQECDVCGHPPGIGFLYECRQDWATPSLRELIQAAKDDGEYEIEVAKSDMRLQLESLGLSQSVIRAAEQGHYTPAQIEKLKAQKKDLRDTISDTLQVGHINDAAAKLAALDQTPSNNDGSTNSIVRNDTVSEIEEFLARLSLPQTCAHQTDIQPGPSSVRHQSMPHLSPILS